MRPAFAAVMLGALAACAATPDRAAVRDLPTEASLDARSLARGAAAERPATVQRQPTPDGRAVFYTVSPRLQTGSSGSPPIIVTSLGAERDAQDQATRIRILVEIRAPRGYPGFARAESRQAGAIEVRQLGRSRDCAESPTCLYSERLMLSVPMEAAQQAVAANAGLRVRLLGNAAYAETGVPAGHLRALLAALAPPPS